MLDYKTIAKENPFTYLYEISYENGEFLVDKFQVKTSYNQEDNNISIKRMSCEPIHMFYFTRHDVKDMFGLVFYHHIINELSHHDKVCISTVFDEIDVPMVVLNKGKDESIELIDNKSFLKALAAMAKPRILS